MECRSHRSHAPHDWSSNRVKLTTRSYMTSTPLATSSQQPWSWISLAVLEGSEEVVKCAARDPHLAVRQCALAVDTRIVGDALVGPARGKRLLLQGQRIGEHRTRRKLNDFQMLA